MTGYTSMGVQLQSLEHGIVQIERQELQAENERQIREMELEKAREAEKQKKLDEAATKQRAREKEIEEREVSLASNCSALLAAYPLLSRLHPHRPCFTTNSQHNTCCTPVHV